MNNKINYNNATKEQRAYIEAIINREILANQSSLVDWLFEKNMLSYEDLENLCPRYCPDCGRDFTVNDENTDTCEYCNDNRDKPQDIMQWFLVDTYMADKLKSIGEPVLYTPDTNDQWWGRTCCGQAISLDPTFWDLFQDGLPR